MTTEENAIIYFLQIPEEYVFAYWTDWLVLVS